MGNFEILWALCEFFIFLTVGLLFLLFIHVIFRFIFRLFLGG